ncbi:MAG: hypothetical protein IKT73_08100, partial [Anaerotignum sp.]|nr:hypothetical protein [Anaerotignum sp.]
LSVVLGNCCFVMAQPEPVYICGYEEHTHTGESGRCYETQKVCGLEENVVHECYLEQGPHEHDDDLCYEYGEPYLDCGVAVEGHLHEDSCYKEVADHDNLLCTEATEAAHEHGDSCVDEEGNEVCDKTVDVVHSHTDDCYGTKTVNTCGIEENHFHDDSCYTRDKNLTCELKEHKCTHEKCWVPAFEGAHKHEKSCDGRVFVCEKPEHEHVDACIQPAEVTALLEKVDALNEIALELRDAKADYEAKTAKVAEIEAEGNAAVDAGEPQEVIDKIMERYLKAEEAKQKALDTMAKAQELFTREWGIVRFEYDQLGGEEHPEYKEMIPAEKLNLIETGVPYDGEEVEVFEMARSVNHSTVGTVAAPNVNIKMFNYDDTINDNLGGIPLNFFNHSSNSEDGYGNKSNDSYNRYYTAGETLVSGFPTANGVSMQPLFDSSYTGVVKESRSYTDGGYLFTKDSNGYYHFDSKVSAAEAGTNRFTVYNAAVMPNGASGEDATRGHFLPFNNLKNVKANGTRYELDYVSGSDTRNEKADMWFGMTMDFQFMMPKDGKVNNKDMVFEFA